MNEFEIRALAKKVLQQLREQTPGHVFAARKGIVAGIRPKNERAYAFRRERGEIHLEAWDWNFTDSRIITEHLLPLDLQEQAAQILDTL